MIYSLLAKVFLGGSVLAYLYSLYQRYQEMAQKNAQAQAQAKISGDLSDIAQKARISSEEVRDFNDAVDKFNSDSNKSS